MSMMTTPDQAAQRPQPVAQHSGQAMPVRIERNGSARPLNGYRHTGNITDFYAIGSAQSRIADEKKGFGIVADQAVEHGAPHMMAEQNRTGTEIIRTDGADLNQVAVADNRVHARATRLKTDRRVLRQQGKDKDFVRNVFWMEFDGHRDEF